MRPHVTLIHNPDSGDAAHPSTSILRLLRDAGYRVRSVSSDGPWRKALRKPTDIVAILGGDGTVGKVLIELVGRDTPIAVLPGGTANNIARTLRAGGDAAAVIDGWASSQTRPLDVWEVRHGERRTRFVEAFGGGFMGSLIERGKDVEKPTLILGGALDRARHLLSDVVAEAPAVPWGVEIDGEEHSGDYIGVEAMSIRSIGPNATFAPDADPGDGLIDVVLIGADMREALLHGIAAMAWDRPGEWPTFPTVRGRSVRLFPPAGCPLHVDDSVWEREPQERSQPKMLTIEHAGRVHYLASG